MIVLCGLAAARCIRSTVQGASENDFKSAVLKHGVADI
jgi:nicotinamidase-related amidase